MKTNNNNKSRKQPNNKVIYVDFGDGTFLQIHPYSWDGKPWGFTLDSNTLTYHKTPNINVVSIAPQGATRQWKEGEEIQEI